MQTPKRLGFYRSISQQCGPECRQMEKICFPPYPKCRGSVMLPMRHGVTLPPVVPLQPWPCPEVRPRRVGSRPQNPNPARPLPREAGICPFFICKTLQAPARGLIYIFCRSSAACPALLSRPVQPQSPGPAWAMLQPGRRVWGCQTPRRELGLSPALTSPANELLHVNVFIYFL